MTDTQLRIQISNDVAAVKADMATFKKNTEENTKRITALEKQPGVKAQAIVDIVYKLILTGVIGYIGTLIVGVLKQ